MILIPLLLAVACGPKVDPEPGPGPDPTPTPTPDPDPTPEVLPSVSTFKVGTSFVIPFGKPLHMPYSGFAKGDKITFISDADKRLVNECVVYLVRGQYVLCIDVAEGEDYEDTMAKNPAYKTIEFERSCENFKTGA